MKNLSLLMLIPAFFVELATAQVRSVTPPITELPSTIAEPQLENITENKEDFEIGKNDEIEKGN